MGWFVNVCHIDCSTACSVTGVWNSPIWIQHWVVLSVSHFPVFFTMTWSILCLSYCLLNFLLGGLSYLKHFKNEELQENIHHFFCSASWSNTGIINLDKMMLPIMFFSCHHCTWFRIEVTSFAIQNPSTIPSSCWNSHLFPHNYFHKFS